MKIAELQNNNGIQTLTLEKDFMFPDYDQVFIERIGNSLVISPQFKLNVDEWEDMREGLMMFTDDFLADEIEDFPPQKRDF